MSVADGALIALRLVGALWLIGGIFLIRQLMTFGKIERALAQIGDDPNDDPGRDRWMMAGGAATTLAGVTMLAGTRWALLAIALVVIHQLAYFIRQRRRELAAKSADDAEEARPARTTINAFFFSLVVAVLAGWLNYVGKLW